jgi:hypothetical protein
MQPRNWNTLDDGSNNYGTYFQGFGDNAGQKPPTKNISLTRHLFRLLWDVFADKRASLTTTSMGITGSIQEESWRGFKLKTFGSIPSIPDTNTKPLAFAAWLYGPIAAPDET